MLSPSSCQHLIPFSFKNFFAKFMKWNCFLRRERKLYERPSPVKPFSQKYIKFFCKTVKQKKSVPMVFFCSTKVFPYRKAPVRSRAGAEAAISPYRSPLFSQRAFPWYPHRDSAGFWLRLTDRPHPFPCPRRRRKVRSHFEIPARSAFQGEQ